MAHCFTSAVYATEKCSIGTLLVCYSPALFSGNLITARDPIQYAKLQRCSVIFKSHAKFIVKSQFFNFHSGSGSTNTQIFKQIIPLVTEENARLVLVLLSYENWPCIDYVCLTNANTATACDRFFSVIVFFPSYSVFFQLENGTGTSKE